MTRRQADDELPEAPLQPRPTATRQHNRIQPSRAGLSRALAWQAMEGSRRKCTQLASIQHAQRLTKTDVRASGWPM